jgi:hypothetical protein
MATKIIVLWNRAKKTTQRYPVESYYWWYKSGIKVYFSKMHFLVAQQKQIGSTMWGNAGGAPKNLVAPDKIWLHALPFWSQL